MLKRQGDEVLGAIQRAGLDPTEFEWREDALSGTYIGDYVIDALIHLPSESPEAPNREFFLFGQDRVVYSPGDDKLRDDRTAQDWPTTLLYVVHWLNNIKRESGPSLWETLAQTRLSAVPSTRFTPEEIATIHRQLDTMAKQIASLNAVTQEQKGYITGELRRIGAAVARMDRADWLRFAIGSMLAVLMSSGLQNSLAASLMRWAVTTFHSLVTGSPLPPLLPP